MPPRGHALPEVGRISKQKDTAKTPKYSSDFDSPDNFDETPVIELSSNEVEE